MVEWYWIANSEGRRINTSVACFNVRSKYFHGRNENAKYRQSRFESWTLAVAIRNISAESLNFIFVTAQLSSFTEYGINSKLNIWVHETTISYGRNSGSLQERKWQILRLMCLTSMFWAIEIINKHLIAEFDLPTVTSINNDWRRVPKWNYSVSFLCRISVSNVTKICCTIIEMSHTDRWFGRHCLLIMHFAQGTNKNVSTKKMSQLPPNHQI
jgi:hypothetical protein